MTHTPEQSDLAKTFLKVALIVSTQGSGPRAQLRRLDVERGSPEFWRIAANCGIETNIEAWAVFVKVIALMTGTRDPGSLHNPKLNLGYALSFDGFSEARFTRLCSCPLVQRREQMVRIARSLSVPSGIDVVQIGYFLFKDTNEGVRDMSRAFFKSQLMQKESA